MPLEATRALEDSLAAASSGNPATATSKVAVTLIAQLRLALLEVAIAIARSAVVVCVLIATVALGDPRSPPALG
jgi:hypothetical protein